MRERKSQEKERETRVIHHGEVNCPELPSLGSDDRSHHRPHFIIAQPTVIESPHGGRISRGRKSECEQTWLHTVEAKREIISLPGSTCLLNCADRADVCRQILDSISVTSRGFSLHPLPHPLSVFVLGAR